MKTKTIFTDKITGLKGEVMDVSVTPGSLEVYVKLENGETVTRKVADLTYLEEKEVDK